MEDFRKNNMTCRRCNKAKVGADIFDVFGVNCNQCSSYRTEKARLKWMSEKKSVLTSCALCCVSFRLNQQRVPHRCSREGVLTCVDCGQQLYSKTDFKKHVKYIHEKEYDQSSFRERLVVKLVEKICPQELSVECNICKIKFSNKKDFKKHTLRYVDVKSKQCKICNKRFPLLRGLKNHIRLHTEKDEDKFLQCKICNKKFMWPENLRLHIQGHKEVRHQCKICNKKFKLGYLKWHMSFHKGEKPYQCKICNKKFSLSTNLKIHMMLHTGDKRHQCKICNKKFALGNYLKIHMIFHTGEKQHQCEICNKKFALGWDLKTHMLSHTGEKPHQCKICNKKFRQSSHLCTHLRRSTCRSKPLSVQNL